MAASCAAGPDRSAPLASAHAWAGYLAQSCTRVALFALEGTAARMALALGLPPAARAAAPLPLTLATPLRWTLEAAAPLMGAGRAPGGGAVAAHLGVATPRGYAVAPIMAGGSLVALLYVDNGGAPLPPGAVQLLALASAGRPLPSPPSGRRHRGRRRPAIPGWRLREPGARTRMLEDDGDPDLGPEADAHGDTAAGVDSDTAADAGRDAAADAGRDIAADAGRDTAADAGRDIAADAGRDTAADAGRDAANGEPCATGAAPPCASEPQAGSGTAVDEPSGAGAAPPCASEPQAGGDTGADEPSGAGATPPCASEPGAGSDAAAPPPRGHADCGPAADRPEPGAGCGGEAALPCDEAAAAAGPPDGAAVLAKLQGAAADAAAATPPTAAPDAAVDAPSPLAALHRRPALCAQADAAIAAADAAARDANDDASARDADDDAAARDADGDAAGAAADAAGAGAGTMPRVPLFAPLPEIGDVLAAAPARRRPWWQALVAMPLGIALAGGGALWATCRPPPGSAAIAFEVPPAAPLPTVAARLAAAGAIRSPRPLLWLARVRGSDRRLRAGYFALPPGRWMWEVLSELEHGALLTTRVTVPEGLTLRETAATVERQGVVPAAALLAAAHDPDLLRRLHIDGANVEGFLFPETYLLRRGIGATEVVETMVREFYRRIRALPGGAGLSDQELYDRVILASLVEREGRHPDELPRIAGVFANRLEHEMRLESCASVQYVLGTAKPRLQLADVRQPSPYNTYLHPGLPPGPIASPGAAALRAALQPEVHDYLFFYAPPENHQRHVFSRTYEAHERAQRAAGLRVGMEF